MTPRRWRMTSPVFVLAHWLWLRCNGRCSEGILVISCDLLSAQVGSLRSCVPFVFSYFPPYQMRTLEEVFRGAQDRGRVLGDAYLCPPASYYRFSARGFISESKIIAEFVSLVLARPSSKLEIPFCLKRITCGLPASFSPSGPARQDFRFHNFP